MHAPYVAATLKTWEETGERKLAKLFARMGVPLAACKQKYVHMSHDLVRQLEAKLEEFGREVSSLVRESPSVPRGSRTESALHATNDCAKRRAARTGAGCQN